MKTEIEINVTPDQLAELFIHWGSDEQANFLNLVGIHFKRAGFDAEGQICSMADDVTKQGRDFLYTLANFVKAQKFKCSSKHFNQLINSYPCDGLQ